MIGPIAFASIHRCIMRSRLRRPTISSAAFASGHESPRSTVADDDPVVATTSIPTASSTPTFTEESSCEGTTEGHAQSCRDEMPNRTYELGRCHVIAENVLTRERALVELTAAKKRRPRVRPLAQLNPEAIAGLRNAIVACQATPKQLQHQADELNAKLAQRRFPASPAEVRVAREKIVAELRSHESEMNDGDFALSGGEHDWETPLDEKLFSEKDKKARETYIRGQVAKELKKTRYNWKPLSFDGYDAAVTYGLARLLPNFAEAYRVLQECDPVKFTPQTVLDYGSGCGSVFWAVDAIWGNAVEGYVAVDPDEDVNRFAIDVMRGSTQKRPMNATAGSTNMDDGGFVHKKVHFRRHLPTAIDEQFDLVVAQRTRIEVGNPQSRQDLLTALWRRTKRYLVLIESALEDSFRSLIEARDFILTAGYELQRDETLQYLRERDCLNEETQRILNDRMIGHYERYRLIKHLCPPENGACLPTMLPPGYVLAPCPHDGGCPLVASRVFTGRTCTARARWLDVRADGRQSVASRDRDGTGITRFSYVILGKGERPESEYQPTPRVMEATARVKHTSLKLCTPFYGIQRVTISKRAGPLYAAVKNTRSGDRLPLQVKVVNSESQFDVFDAALADFEREKQQCAGGKH